MTTNAIDVPALAREIAAELGWGWSEVTDQDHSAWSGYARLSGPDGAGLVLRTEQGNDKLIVTGAYPAHDVYGLRAPRIGVTATRGAEVIAREIRRRLIPEYLRGLATVREDNDKQVAWSIARSALADRLADHLTDPRVHPDKHGTEIRTYSDRVSVRVRINLSGTGGDLEITGLSADQLAAVLTHL